MRNLSNSFWVAALLPILTAGCRDREAVSEYSTPSELQTLTYTPRSDLLVIMIPEGVPVRWPAAGYPPTYSVRDFPNTPDRDLAIELRRQFGKTVLDPTDLSLLLPVQSDRLERLLNQHFGTPAAPTVLLPSWDDVAASATIRGGPDATFGDILKETRSRLRAFKWDMWKSDWEAAGEAHSKLRLDDESLRRGALVYRRWCGQCHGVTGEGERVHATDGGPMPRDFRQGLFKYVTALPPANLPKKGLGAVGKPRREDLARMIRAGVDGTIMPAFATLTDQEIEDVVSYVIHLSIRGETEFATLAKITNVNKLTEADPDYFGAELDWLFIQNKLWVLYNWGSAANHPIEVPVDPATTAEERLASAIRGYKFYHAAEFGCASCHADYGRVPQLKWDAWGTVVQPRNLLPGVYRGGRTGKDLYARIYGGIAPSGMTAFHDRVTGAESGTPDKIWDIVHFLQALGDPRERRRMQELDQSVKFEP